MHCFLSHSWCRALAPIPALTLAVYATLVSACSSQSVIELPVVYEGDFRFHPADIDQASGANLAPGDVSWKELHSSWQRGLSLKVKIAALPHSKRALGLVVNNDGMVVGMVSHFEEEKDGPFLLFWPRSGTVYLSTHFSHGVQDGVFVSYYEDGIVYQVGQFVAGNRSGTWRGYFPNGHLSFSGVMNGDERVGGWKYYFQNGTLRAAGAYHSNRPDGEWTYYYPNSSTSSTGLFKEGEYHGLWKFYDKTGVLIEERRYDMGKIVE